MEGWRGRYKNEWEKSSQFSGEGMDNGRKRERLGVKEDNYMVACFRHSSLFSILNNLTQRIGWRTWREAECLGPMSSRCDFITNQDCFRLFLIQNNTGK